MKNEETAEVFTFGSQSVEGSVREEVVRQACLPLGSVQMTEKQRFEYTKLLAKTYRLESLAQPFRFVNIGCDPAKPRLVLHTTTDAIRHILKNQQDGLYTEGQMDERSVAIFERELVRRLEHVEHVNGLMSAAEARRKNSEAKL